MKPFLFIILTLLFFQNPLNAQKLNQHKRDSLKVVLDEMGELDQKYRWQLMYGITKKTEVDSINKLPVEQIRIICKENQKNNKAKNDSLGRLQNEIDSINKEPLIAIINEFGFPSPKRIKSWTGDFILLHFTTEDDFKVFNPLLTKELKKGNLKGLIYAEWHDRILHDKGLPQLYGAYGKNPKIEDLNKTNLARKEIGLKKFEHRKVHILTLN